jgi:uncharacterized protein YkwD
VGVTDTEAAPPTETPAATETTAASPTVTATLETPVPTNLPGCTNSASFVVDVTFPDNSPVSAGTAFTKTWTVKNTGTCIWGPDYTLTHYSEERMGAPVSVPLAVTYPGQTVDISVALAAPSALGSHRGNFVIKNPGGLIMKIDEDSRLWVIVNVTEALAGGTAIPVTGSSSATPGSGAPTGTRTPGGTTSGSGFANVTCAFTTDAAKVAETINAINAYRAQNGVAAYPINELLAKAAQAHANDMACNQLFFHNGSNGSTPQSRVAASGYVASSVSENVYGSYPPLTGQGVVTWWVNDRTDVRHNQNLLSTKFTEIGVGYSFYNNFGYYVVVFAAP